MFNREEFDSLLEAYASNRNYDDAIEFCKARMKQYANNNSCQSYISQELKRLKKDKARFEQANSAISPRKNSPIVYGTTFFTSPKHSQPKQTSAKRPKISDQPSTNSLEDSETSKNLFQSNTAKSKTKSNQSKQEKEEERRAIGRLGEQKVYDHLKTKYRKEGFTIIEEKKTSLGCRLKHLSTLQEIKIIWCNKKGESGYPYDIVIRDKKINNEKEEIKYIEVKATKKSEASNAIFSGQELQAMRFFGKDYSIYRVYNACLGEEAKISDPVPIDDPYPKIFSEPAKEENIEILTSKIGEIKIKI